MTKIRTYATANAFRIALETRLKGVAKEEGTDLQRLRRQVAFDRFLARLFPNRETPWILKGGYALEVRMHQARTTKDIDLTLESSMVRGLTSEHEMMPKGNVAIGPPQP